MSHSVWGNRVSVRLGGALLALACASCSYGSEIEGRLSGLQEIIDQAERNGAYRCAPRELALARANIEFGRIELAQGDPGRAEAHYVVAEPNARAAFRLSPPARCAPRGVAIARRPDEPPPPQRQDRDGDGYFDDEDTCPEQPENFDGHEDQDGCPDDADSDGDRIPNSADACVTEPEDADNYLDQDGCPEADNDVDGVLDASDRCANDPEDRDDFEDADGCPDRDNDADGLPDVNDQCPNEVGPADNQGCPRVYQDVQVTGTAIRITQTIHFEFNRAVIRPESFGILNTVAQVLRDFPQINIEVQGHTDSRGNDDLNLRLSQARADAVRDYLVQQGIAAGRLTSRGYGETMPIDSNRTAQGRAANRRVEFVRTDSEARGSTP